MQLRLGEGRGNTWEEGGMGAAIALRWRRLVGFLCIAQLDGHVHRVARFSVERRWILGGLTRSC